MFVWTSQWSFAYYNGIVGNTSLADGALNLQDYRHFALARFAPAMFRSRKRQFAPDPTCVSLPFFNFEFHNYNVYFHSWKIKKLCFVSTHVKLFYDNGILNLKTLLQWCYVRSEYHVKCRRRSGVRYNLRRAVTIWVQIRLFQANLLILYCSDVL